MLSQLFNDILSRDILSRNIRKEGILEEFAYYLAGNVTSLLSFNKMANYFKSRGLKVSVPTLENYFRLIKNSFMFFDNLLFSYKIKDQLKNPKKIYCIDNGVFNSVGLKFSKDFGKMYENAVFLKLKNMAFANPSVNVFYWKNIQHEEVDFAVKEGIKIKQLVQVCYDVENLNTKKRETKALLKASKELKCNNLLVISKDYEGEEKLDGKKIKFIPLWKWLLG